MIMTVKQTPKHTRISVSHERNPNIMRCGRIKGTISGERSAQSISRAKRILRDIAECNDFDFFVTLEFSPHKIKIKEQEKAIKEVTSFFKKLKRTYKKLAWVMVPEFYPNSKRMHVHALVKDFPKGLLLCWTHRKGRRPKYVKDLLKQGREVYTIPSYDARWGYALVTTCIAASNIANRATATASNADAGLERTARYMGKDLNETAKRRPVGARLIYTSQGLAKPQVMEKRCINVAEQKKIQKNTNRSYPHRNPNTGTNYGITYITDTPWSVFAKKAGI